MSNFEQIIEKYCSQYALDKQIVEAICEVESNFDTYAVRYEDHWRWLFNPEFYALKNNISLESEKQLQKFSWGVMQIMGSVARELGFEGPITKLCNPDIGIGYGCAKLKQQLIRYNGDYQAAVSAYNQGTAYKNPDGTFRNQDYVNKVYRIRGK